MGEVYVTACVSNSSQWGTSTGARGERKRSQCGRWRWESSKLLLAASASNKFAALQKDMQNTCGTHVVWQLQVINSLMHASKSDHSSNN